MTSRTFKAFELTLPRDLEVGSVAAFLSSIGAMKRPVGPFGVPVVGLEVQSDAGGIAHTLLVELEHEAFVLGQLRTFLPGLRIDPMQILPRAVGAIAVAQSVEIAVELRTTHHGRPLRLAPEEVSSAIIGSLSPLNAEEEIRIQWLLAPRSRPKPNTIKNRPQGDSVLLIDHERELVDDMERLRARDQKQREPLLVAIGRVAVSAGSAVEAKQLVRRVLAAVRSAEAPGVRLVNRLIASRTVLRRMNERQVPLLDWGLTLNAPEAAGLLALPYGSLVAPGLSLGSSAQLPPRIEIPLGLEEGSVVLGRSTFPNMEDRTIGLAYVDRLQHLHVMGPTGTGKSTLLGNLVLQDIDAGRGVVLLDPKGDLVSEVLRRLPPSRINDVIILDPTDAVRPVGFNPLWVESTDRHIIDRDVDFVVGTLHSLYEKTWGPRTEDTLRAACLSLILAADPTKPYTLCDVAELLVGGKEFRASVVAKLQDRDLLLFWAWFEHLPQPEKLIMLGPVLNKLRAFTLRVAIRSVIGQPKGLDLARVLSEGRILLVPLPKGVIGQETTALLGSLLVSALWQVTLERAALPSDQRPPVFFTLDEVQEFLRLPGDIGEALTQARSLNVGMTLAHQHLAQLEKDFQAAVEANARSKVYFQLNHRDAAVVAPSLGGWLTTEDLENLPVREAVLVPLVGSQVMPPCTLLTLPLPLATGDDLEPQIRAASAQKWGTPIEELVSTRPLSPPMSERRSRGTSNGRRGSKPASSVEASGSSGRGNRAPLSGAEP